MAFHYLEDTHETVSNGLKNTRSEREGSSHRAKSRPEWWALAEGSPHLDGALPWVLPSCHPSPPPSCYKEDPAGPEQERAGEPGGSLEQMMATLIEKVQLIKDY